MKLHKLFLVSTLALVLAGCAEDLIEESQSDEDLVSEVVEQEGLKESQEMVEAPEQEEIEEETLEIDENEPLENIGEYKYTIQGRVELIDIFRPSEVYNLVDGVEINFTDIKVLHYSEIPESEKEFLRSIYGFDNEGHTLQLAYSVTNSTDDTWGGIEVEDIVTSNGNQYNLYNDGGPITGSSYEVRPQATTNVGVVFSIENPNIEGLTLYFQPVDNEGWLLNETVIDLNF